MIEDYETKHDYRLLNDQADTWHKRNSWKSRVVQESLMLIEKKNINSELKWNLIQTTHLVNKEPSIKTVLFVQICIVSSFIVFYSINEWTMQKKKRESTRLL